MYAKEEKKYLVDKVNPIEANPHYAHVRLPDGHETTISTKQLASYSQICNDTNQQTIQAYLTVI